MFNTLEEAENFGRDLAKEVKAAIEQRCAALEIKIGRLNLRWPKNLPSNTWAYIGPGRPTVPAVS